MRAKRNGRSRSEPASEEPPEVIDPAPTASVGEAPTGYLAGLLHPSDAAQVLGVEFYRRERNHQGIPVSIRLLSFEGAHGRPCKRLDMWADLSKGELEQLFGGGEFRVCCRGATGIVRWLSVQLDGPERDAPQEQSSQDPDGPGAARSVQTALGAIVSPEDVPREVRPVVLWLQQALLTERERYQGAVAVARADADARARQAEAYARQVVALSDARVAEAKGYAEKLQAALSDMTKLQIEIVTSALANTGTATEVLKLLGEERKAASESRKKQEDLTKQIHDLELAKKHKTGALDVLRELRLIAPHGKEAVKAFFESWAGIGQKDAELEAGVAAAGEAAAAVADAIGPK